MTPDARTETPRTDECLKMDAGDNSALVLYRIIALARTLEKENAPLRRALEACVDAASHDVVEDFSAVSNAADEARACLAAISGEK